MPSLSTQSLIVAALAILALIALVARFAYQRRHSNTLSGPWLSNTVGPSRPSNAFESRPLHSKSTGSA